MFIFIIILWFRITFYTDVPVRINKLSLAYPTHVACLDIPETNSSVKKTGAIKSIMRRSLPGGGGSSPCRKRLPSPHWRHKYSLPITVSNLDDRSRAACEAALP